MQGPVINVDVKFTGGEGYLGVEANGVKGGLDVDGDLPTEGFVVAYCRRQHGQGVAKHEGVIAYGVVVASELVVALGESVKDHVEVVAVGAAAIVWRVGVSGIEPTDVAVAVFE